MKSEVVAVVKRQSMRGKGRKKKQKKGASPDKDGSNPRCHHCPQPPTEAPGDHLETTIRPVVKLIEPKWIWYYEVI